MLAITLPVLAGLLAALAVALVYVDRRWPRNPPAPRLAPPAPHPMLGRKVIVNTRKPDDQSHQGILIRAEHGWLVLQAVQYRVVTGEATARWDPLPGDVTITEAAVSWMIEVPAA